MLIEGLEKTAVENYGKENVVKKILKVDEKCLSAS